MTEVKKDNLETPIKTLQAKKEKLTGQFLKGTLPDFPRHHTRILDEYFFESYENSVIGPKIIMQKNPYAVIALGGYGREEQCIHSDVDLLFLFERAVPEEAVFLVEEMVYPLWDMGIQTGHAIRSLEDCISAASDDIEILTALLDARFICGMSFLYSRLMDRLRENLLLKQGDVLVDRLIQRNVERHERFGDSTYMLEPNLKEGIGGLRDYHTVLWIARIRNNLRQPRDLEFFGCVSHDEYQTLIRALEFIWQVRSRLHYIVGRKWDHLRFRYQEQLAADMNYRKRRGQQPVEQFLGELHRHMEFLKDQEQMTIYEMETVKKRRRRIAEPRVGGLIVENGMLGFVSSESIHQNSILLIRIFEESARLKIPLSAESKRLVRDFLHRVGKKFRASEPAIRSFEYILLTPVSRFNVLEAMLETGFMERYISEFSRIVSRIQYDEYHLFPVDKHLLRTVQTVKKFGTENDPTGKPLCGDLYQNLESPKLLLWAALLHDIGKGDSQGDHAERGTDIARNILAEKKYSEKEIETVVFLVRYHLYLVEVATRRDILDEETAIQCARTIRDIERLKMLYLLTVADSIATGPKAWNAWTASLIQQHFLNILNILEKGELASGDNMRLVAQKKERVLQASETPEERKERNYLLQVMSPRYLLYTDPADMEAHIRLYRSLSDKLVTWQIRRTEAHDTRQMTICAKDSPGLFSKIAGVLTLNGINILDAQIFTWRNNIALDVFEVSPPPDRFYEDRTWERVGAGLEKALDNRLDLGAALAEKMAVYGTGKPRTSERPNRIRVDNTGSSFFTIIEVFTYDYPGLLFGITDALFKCRLDIWVAKIATKVDQVVDVFYIRDFDGQKVDSPEQEAAIREAVEKVLLPGSQQD